MAPRRYGQYCCVAKALDILGERWTLLIVRELLTGPKRYKDLLDNLPGIGTNLLAARLERLAEAGILERATLPPPAGSRVYRLTPRGLQLEPVLIALGRWGLPYLRTPPEGDEFRPGWALLAMKITFRPQLARELEETYQLEVGETVFHVEVDRGEVRTAQGPAARPDLVLRADPPSFFDLAAGRLSLREGLERGSLECEGPDEALERLDRLFRV